MGEEKQVDRRSFMRIATWAIGGLIGIGLGIPAIAYIIGPVLQQDRTRERVRIGSTSKVELGTPTLFKTSIERQTGWIVDVEELTVYVLTDNMRDFIAMSNICTHLGCRVRWVADQEEFFCPCHNAIFDRQGNVVSGPPPAPLERYEVEVEDDQLFIVLGG